MPSKLPLSFLCQNVTISQEMAPGSTFTVPGYRATHCYYTNLAGKVTFLNHALPTSQNRITDGWQFFISIMPEDRDKAWLLIAPFLLAEDSVVLAFSVDDSKTRGVVPEEAFVLYTFRSRSGCLLQSPEAMLALCRNIEKALLNANIHTSDDCSNTIKLRDFKYISMKYLDENIKRNQNQSSSCISIVNPYQGLVKHALKGTFFSSATAITDGVEEGDDESIMSELTVHS